MSEIGAYEAKTHLPELLKRVEKGERFLITKHGRPVAALVPLRDQDPESIRRTIADIRLFRNRLGRRGFHLQGLLEKDQSLRELAHQEHRY
jgi:prevent-host-death family protein